MSYKPHWWRRINEIEATVEHLATPVLDRECFEVTFGIARRRAHALMRECGGYQAGRTWLVERPALLDYLRRKRLDPGFQSERKRRKRLASALQAAQEMARGRQIRIVVPRGGDHRGFLPAGCRLERGQLAIEFSNVEELLGRLYDLSQAIASGYDEFAALIEARLH